MQRASEDPAPGPCRVDPAPLQPASPVSFQLAMTRLTLRERSHSVHRRLSTSTSWQWPSRKRVRCEHAPCLHFCTMPEHYRN